MARRAKSSRGRGRGDVSTREASSRGCADVGGEGTEPDAGAGRGPTSTGDVSNSASRASPKRLRKPGRPVSPVVRAFHCARRSARSICSSSGESFAGATGISRAPSAGSAAKSKTRCPFASIGATGTVSASVASGRRRTSRPSAERVSWRMTLPRLGRGAFGARSVSGRFVGVASGAASKRGKAPSESYPEPVSGASRIAMSSAKARILRSTTSSERSPETRNARRRATTIASLERIGSLARGSTGSTRPLRSQRRTVATGTPTREATAAGVAP